MVPTPSIPPSINAQIIYDERPGGTRMPVLKSDGSVLRHKEYMDNRNEIEARRRAIRNDTTALRS